MSFSFHSLLHLLCFFLVVFFFSFFWFSPAIACLFPSLVSYSILFFCLVCCFFFFCCCSFLLSFPFFGRRNYVCACAVEMSCEASRTSYRSRSTRICRLISPFYLYVCFFFFAFCVYVDATVTCLLFFIIMCTIFFSLFWTYTQTHIQCIRLVSLFLKVMFAGKRQGYLSLIRHECPLAST
jgi:hypothetical protein